MAMVQYRLEIVTDGLAATPHSRAIFRADEQFPIEKSRAHFRTPLLARMAGGKILRRLEYKHEDSIMKAKR
jgi:hypothetical protein